MRKWMVGLATVFVMSSAWEMHSWPLTTNVLAARQPQPSVQEVNDRFAREWMDRIGDRRNQSAQQVFKNMKIEWLKTEPAQNLIDIMNFGYAKALGVQCTYCHVADDFASDAKRPKNAAREMAVMHHDINQQLSRMQSLSDPPDQRSINCAVCHRGAINPNTVPR